MAYHRTKTVFDSGDTVEVGSKETGFWASYYKARVVRNFGDNYVVEYEDLLENDGKTLYKDTVPPDDVRPLPPRTDNVVKFRYGDQVDAFHNDGWWAGIVTGKGDGCYNVFFETTWDHIAYPVSKLRPHLDWVKGRWFPGKNVDYYLSDVISVPPVVPLMVYDREFGNSGIDGEDDQDHGKNHKR